MALKAFQKYYKPKSCKAPISKQPRFVSNKNLSFGQWIDQESSVICSGRFSVSFVVWFGLIFFKYLNQPLTV